MEQRWRSDELLAWTEREGPSRPPRGPNRHLLTGLGAGLALVFSVILRTDTLCPEHRAWVTALATAALVGAVVATVGLVQRWAMAPALTVLVTSCGVAIGMIDSIHSVERGRLIAVAFALLTFGALLLCLWQARLAWWDRTMRRELRSAAPAPAATPHPIEPADQPATASEDQPAPNDPVSVSDTAR